MRVLVIGSLSDQEWVAGALSRLLAFTHEEHDLIIGLGPDTRAARLVASFPPDQAGVAAKELAQAVLPKPAAPAKALLWGLFKRPSRVDQPKPWPALATPKRALLCFPRDGSSTTPERAYRVLQGLRLRATVVGSRDLCDLVQFAGLLNGTATTAVCYPTGSGFARGFDDAAIAACSG